MCRAKNLCGHAFGESFARTAMRAVGKGTPRALRSTCGTELSDPRFCIPGDPRISIDFFVKSLLLKPF